MTKLLNVAFLLSGPHIITTLDLKLLYTEHWVLQSKLFLKKEFNLKTPCEIAYHMYVNKSFVLWKLFDLFTLLCVFVDVNIVMLPLLSVIAGGTRAAPALFLGSPTQENIKNSSAKRKPYYYGFYLISASL